MTRYFRQLAVTAAALGVASAAIAFVEPPPPPPEPTPPTPAKAAPAKAGEPVVMKFAVDPLPLTDAVKSGLKYLANQQQDDGGWSQGGGWRTALNGQSGRIEGAEVEDPSDVGNTCIALLALIRAGNTPDKGEYKENVRKGLTFVYGRVEKADKDDLYVTDVRNTQLQSKIGPFVDTFLAGLVLSEIKGKGGAEEKRLVKALDKTIGKIAKHQKEDGTIAGNGGWAPVLSQALCNKTLARASQNGVYVKRELLARAAVQSDFSVNGPAKVAEPIAKPTATTTAEVPTKPGEAVATLPPAVTTKPASGPATFDAPDALYGRRSSVSGGFAGAGLGGVGDAGVPLYRFSQGAGNLQDVLNSVTVDAQKAREVLKDANASDEEKQQAEKTVKEVEQLEAKAVDARKNVAAQAKNVAFVKGFGNNGGEEFLSFMNISEMLVLNGGKDWTEWNGKMQTMLAKAQDQNGSWSGHHCITGKTFCTASALLVMMADRTPFPVDVIEAAREANKAEKKNEEAPKEEPAGEDK